MVRVVVMVKMVLVVMMNLTVTVKAINFSQKLIFA